MRRLSMNLTRLLARAEFQAARKCGAIDTAPGPTNLAALSMRRGAKWLELLSAIPASWRVTVPALMSVFSPSIRKVMARRARDTPLLECVPVMRPKRT